MKGMGWRRLKGSLAIDRQSTHRRRKTSHLAVSSGPEGEIHGNRELTAMPGYNELADPRAVGTEREETRWNR